jgi:2-keto-3-deoxy-galactonokinase
VTQDDLVRFVAATEAAIAGTPDAGVVEEQPETYIALGQAACARFTGGESFEVVAADMLAELDASGASERLVGAIIGAATRTLCSEHADLVTVD